MMILMNNDFLQKFKSILYAPDKRQELLQYRNDVEDYIRDNVLDDEIIKALWQLSTFKDSLIKRQIFSDNMITNIIKDFKKGKKNKKTYSLIYRIIRYQKLNDDHIRLLLDSDLKVLLELWKNIPERLSYIEGEYNKLLEIVKKEDYISYHQTSKQLLLAIDSICTKLPQGVGDIINATLESYINQDLLIKILTLIAKRCYIGDSYINMIQKKIDEQYFPIFTDIIIRRKHCSEAMKAKLMLLK